MTKYMFLISLFLLVGIMIGQSNDTFATFSVSAAEEQQANINQTEKDPQTQTIYLLDPNSKEIVETIVPKPYELEINFQKFQSEVEQIVKKLAVGTTGKSGYNKSIILDRLNPTTNEIIYGRPTITLNEEELVDKILQHSFTGGVIEIPLTYTKSGYIEKDAPHLNEVVLASYTTFFNPYNTGRSNNIELSAASIHNVIVGSGDIFSFNNTVGPRDVTAGYQEAPEFIKGKIVIGIGGGICQTSSTLFNAVDQLGVEIIERHRHSRDIGYVPKGRDATVSFGGLDFSFKNTTGIPFLIKTYYGKGYLTVQIKTSKENEYILRNLEND